jgi:spore coat protein U-like protein
MRRQKPPISKSLPAAAACTITALPLNFPNYLEVNLFASTTVTVKCTNGTPYVIGMDAGIGTAATAFDRRMMKTTAPTTALLYYNLCSSGSASTCTNNWGNGSTVVAGEVAGTGDGLPAGQVITVYGRIPPGQNALVGSCGDT